jgi:structural maintenance of chromosome 1
MSPKDLTALFEHISGSEALRKEYEEGEARMREAEEATAVIFARKKTVTQGEWG